MKVMKIGVLLFTVIGILNTLQHFVVNTGWLTHKNADIIHGVKQHSVTGKRHSVIINYISGNWRDTICNYSFKINTSVRQVCLAKRKYMHERRANTSI